MINMLLSGCYGKMGRYITETLVGSKDYKIVAGVDIFAGAKEFDYPVFDDYSKCDIKADVIVDFTRPSALPGLLDYVIKTKTPLVLATTGHSKEEMALISNAATFAPIFKSANMSLGVNLMLELLEQTTRFLGNSYDIEIVEKHHNRKIDAPSGTAMMIANVINDAAGGDLEYVFDRHSKFEPRTKREIGIHAVRGGTMVGEHSVIFAGVDEVIEINHIAQSRQIFANGAIRAAGFIANCPIGLYSMQDLISKDRIVTRAYYSATDSVVTICDIPSSKIIADIFSAMANSEINIDMISQPAPIKGLFALSFSLPSRSVGKAVDALSMLIASDKLEVLNDVAKLSVEGSGMERQAGAASLVFGTLASLNIPSYLITTSETKISCCVPLKNAESALNALKKQFGIE